MEHYPLPKVQDLFSTLAGGTLFTMLDMSQAYASNSEYPQRPVCLQ